MSHGGGFSCGEQVLGAWASVVPTLGFGLSSCGAWATRVELVSPVLAGDSHPLYHQGSPVVCNSNIKVVQSVQFISVAQSCPTLWTPWTAAHQASLSITNFWNLLKLTSIELMMPSNHLILYHPLLLPPSICPSVRVFSVLPIMWPKYWSFSFSINPSNEYSGLISFRMDWLDLVAAQGTLKSLLQHHSSKASILWRSAFFMVQLHICT